MNWFCLKGQKNIGPLTLSQLKKEILNQRIGFFDQICKEPDMIWSYVYECKELICYLEEVELDLTQEWTVLKTNQEMCGPFSLEQIKQKILKGEFKYTDHLWREGLSQWMPIIEVESINSKRKCELSKTYESSQVELKKDQRTKQEILANLTYQKRDVIYEEVIPAEADGPDLLSRD